MHLSRLSRGGGADVIVDWMGGALAAREKGVDIVNIAQPFKKAGMRLVCPKDGPVQTTDDFPGHTLGCLVSSAMNIRFMPG